MSEANGVKVSIFDQFVTSPELEDDGVWRVIDGWRFKIARSLNPRHRSVLESLPEHRRRAYMNGELDQPEADKVLATIVARGLLRDWDERFDEPFGPDTAEVLLAKAPHLADAISGVAANYRAYLARDLERDAKN